MALARLWDHGRSPIGFSKIAAELASADVLSALSASAEAWVERRHSETRDARTGDLLSAADPIRFQERQDRMPEIVAEARNLVSNRVSSWLNLYQSYSEDRIRDGLSELRTVRDKRIAHWDEADIANGTTRTYRLHRIGRVLRASELLVERALLLSRDEHLRFVETHRLYALEASRFWSRLCPTTNRV